MKIIKKLLHRWYILIGLAIFSYIIYKIDLAEVWQTLSQANLYFIILSILLTLLMFSLLPWRWNYLKRVQKINYSFKDSFLIYNAGFLFSAITPGHLGDLIKVFYLKKDSHSVGKSLVSVVLDRLADVSFLFLVGYLSMYFFARFFWKQLIILSVVILVILILIIIYQKTKAINLLADKLIQLTIPKRYQKSWQINYQDFINNLKIYKFKNYLVFNLITIIHWLIFYLSMFLLAKSIDLNEVSFVFLAMSITLAILVTLIPISIFGLGTREAALLFFFSFFAVSPEKTISFSALYLLTILVGSLLGLICWLKKPLKLKG